MSLHRLDVSVGFVKFDAVCRSRPPRKCNNTSSRGEIKEFSRRSRLRLAQKLLSFVELPRYMITLTYPDEYPSTSVAKEHLHTFLIYLQRQGLAGCWKLEYQKRGAPHFHLLVWGEVEDLSSFRLWVSETWYRIVGSDDLKHLKAGTRVDFLRDPKEVIRYVLKYVVKDEGGVPDSNPGRFWGFFNREKLPEKFLVSLELSYSEWVKIKRYVRKWAMKVAKRKKKIVARYFNHLRIVVFLPSVLFVQKLVRFVVGEPVDVFP